MNNPVPMVAVYRGRRADELTREELLVAFTDACKELDMLRHAGQQEREMEQLFRDTEKRVRGY